MPRSINLPEQYHGGGADGIDKVKDEMFEPELLPSELQGLVSIVGLDIKPSITPEELHELDLRGSSGSSYVRLPSISNQVVEGNEGDGSDTESLEDTDEEDDWYKGTLPMSAERWDPKPFDTLPKGDATFPQTAKSRSDFKDKEDGKEDERMELESYPSGALKGK